jgi:(p)ppGpp synthase/HD superfamily hydrolase
VTPQEAFMLTDRYARAFSYVSELHRDQLRKGTAIPYLTHLMAVSVIVLEQGGSEDQAIAALLLTLPPETPPIFG